MNDFSGDLHIETKHFLQRTDKQNYTKQVQISKYISVKYRHTIFLPSGLSESGEYRR